MNLWTTIVGVFLASVAVWLLARRTHTSRLAAWAAWFMAVTGILIAQGNQFELAHDAHEAARVASEESKLHLDAVLNQSNLRFQTLMAESDRRFEDLLKALAKVEKLPPKQRQAALTRVLGAYKKKESLVAAVGDAHVENQTKVESQPATSPPPPAPPPPSVPPIPPPAEIPAEPYFPPSPPPPP